MPNIKRLDDNSGLVVTFIQGQIQKPTDVSARVARLGQAGSELQITGNAAPPSRLLLTIMAETLSEAQDFREILLTYPGRFLDIEDENEEIFTCSVVGGVAVRLLRGAYVYAGVTYDWRVECDLTVEAQP